MLAHRFSIWHVRLPIGADSIIRIGDADVAFSAAMGRNIAPGSTAGLPGLVLPAGLADGLPVAIELDGPAGTDRRLLGIGLAIEALLGPLVLPAYALHRALLTIGQAAELFLAQGLADIAWVPPSRAELLRNRPKRSECSTMRYRQFAGRGLGYFDGLPIKQIGFERLVDRGLAPNDADGG